MTVVDQVPGDAAADNLYGSEFLCADILIQRFDNTKGAGVVPERRADKKGLALILYNAGNTDRLVLATVEGHPAKAGKLAIVKSVSLGGLIQENAWYRVLLTAVVDGPPQIMGQVFKHTGGRIPTSAITQVGGTLVYTPKSLPDGVDDLGQNAIIGSAFGAVGECQRDELQQYRGRLSGQRWHARLGATIRPDPGGRRGGLGARSRTHFSMIRNFHLADLFTIANGFCGVAALFWAMKFLATGARAHLYTAALFVPLALVFDVLDGRIARWRHKSSPMGRELDSLADVISFGVAPACIGFAAGLDSAVDQLILMYFVGCGVSRLARYNVTADDLAAETGKVRYFEGTPIPTSVVPLGLLMAAFHRGACTRSSARRGDPPGRPALSPVRQPDDQQDPQDSQAVESSDRGLRIRFRVPYAQATRRTFRRAEDLARLLCLGSGAAPPPRAARPSVRASTPPCRRGSGGGAP